MCTDLYQSDKSLPMRKFTGSGFLDADCSVTKTADKLFLISLWFSCKLT